MSTIDVANLTDGTDTVATGYVINGSSKCFVRYDGSSVQVGTSLNVSSLTDGGTTGMTTVGMTSAMSNSNFVVSATCNGTTGSRYATVQTSISSAFDTYTWDVSTRSEQPVGAAVNGDLA